MIIKKDRSKIRARHDFESLRNPARDRGLNFAWISLEFFRTVIKLFTYTEVNSFPPLHLAEGNFSAPFVGNFLGENLAAGVAEVSKKRKIVKDLFQSLSYFLVPAPCPSSGVSKILCIFDRASSSSTRLDFISPFFFFSILRGSRVTLSRVNMKIQRSSSPRVCTLVSRCGTLFIETFYYEKRRKNFGAIICSARSWLRN